jgi:hypothetical protein
MSLALQRKVDPHLPLAMGSSSRVQRELVERLRRQRQLAQRQLEDTRQRWHTELGFPVTPSPPGF